MAATLARKGQTDISRYVESFARFEERMTGDSQAWLKPLRRAGLDRFTVLGFPTARDEDWRFTNLTPLIQTAFRPAWDRRSVPAAEALARFAIPGLTGCRLVFVDGRYAPSLSSLAAIPPGVQIGSLADAPAGDVREAIRFHLGQYVDAHGDPFSALNSAFLEDGALVLVPRGVVVSEPIHLLYVSTAGPEPTITHPRTLVVSGENCQATILEDFVSLGEGVHFSNAVSEVVAGDHSVLAHYFIQRENPRAFHISTLRVQQEGSSSVTTHSVLLGGALTRRNVHPVLAGEGAECLINGLFMPTGRQHMDNYMKVEHTKPHCSSRQFYKGILDGQARGVFHGRIIVHKDAQKTDAKQTNMNLLLSEDAQIDTKPQLEIYADDVKCTHGATIGQIDDDAIFYLRSRGIGEAAARALLLFAFAGESLQRMTVEPIRRHLEMLVKQWMSHGDLVEGVR